MQRNIVEEIKDKLKISDVIGEHIDLQKEGNNFKGLCPFHADTEPSMIVSDKKRIFKCFVCGEHGDSISFIQKYKQKNFKEALNYLGAKIGINYEIKKETNNYDRYQLNKIKVLKKANDFFVYMLHTEEKSREYLKSRGLNFEEINELEIGYSGGSKEFVNFMEGQGFSKSEMIAAGLLNEKGNSIFYKRIMFPIKNKFGNIIAFSGRTMDKNESVKYLNSASSDVFEKNKVFYNLNRALHDIKIKREVFIVEGFFDVIALNRIGINNVVASLGINLSDEQIKSVSKLKVNLLYDSDSAGKKATIKNIKKLLEAGVKNENIKALYSEKHLDPYEIITKFGKGIFIDILNNLGEKSLNFKVFIYQGVEFVLEHVLSARGHASFNNNETKIKVIKYIREFTKYLDKIELGVYTKTVSEKTGWDFNWLLSVFK